MIAISEPCPFCGANAGFRLDSDTVGRQDEQQEQMWVGCVNCGAGGPNASTPEHAMLLWNQRIAAINDDLSEMAQWESALKGGLLTGTARDVIRARAERVLRRVVNGPGGPENGGDTEVRSPDGPEDSGREHELPEGHGEA